MLRMPRPRRQSRQVPQNDSHLRARSGPMPLHHSMEHTALLESGACLCDEVKIAKKVKSHHNCNEQLRNLFIFQGAEKQYYISKRCATQHECDKEINGNMAICHYIWYEDWRCAECCQGDRCNYYVTASYSCRNSLILDLEYV